MKGFGSYKLDLVNELVRTFHRNPFRYKDAKQLPNFEHIAFMRLYHDGSLTLIKNGSDRIWQVSGRYSKVTA
jgi:hypothetical protein